jgi:hypothetical protein
MKTDAKYQKTNTALWDAVSRTDPSHTRHVNQRGGFTAIDSYYQIQRATEIFGPLGQGWGFDAEYRFEQNLAIAVVKLWYVWEGKKSEPFSVCAANQLVTVDKTGRQHLDEDAAKKALTDAITKGLSYLGFSADVFMGKFDDNRYVQGLKQTLKAEQEERDVRLEIAELEDEMHMAMQSVEDATTYHLARERLIPNFLRLKALAPQAAGQYEARMLELKRHYATPRAVRAEPKSVENPSAARKRKAAANGSAAAAQDMELALQ